MRQRKTEEVLLEVPMQKVYGNGKKEDGTTRFQIMPPRPGVCPYCAAEHDERAPHNPQSLYYQYRFFSEYGVWPNWGDAMKHCSEEVKATWKDELMKRGFPEADFIPHEKRAKAEPDG